MAVRTKELTGRQWRVEIYNGATLAATDTFTIGTPQPPTCTG